LSQFVSRCSKTLIYPTAEGRSWFRFARTKALGRLRFGQMSTTSPEIIYGVGRRIGHELKLSIMVGQEPISFIGL
jgi:hypothetical protein